MVNWNRNWLDFSRLFSITLAVMLGLKLFLASPAVAQSPTGFIQQGNQISIDGKSYPVPWGQWQEGNQTHTGLGDTGAMQVLGLDLLNNTSPSQQPVQWFSGDRQNLNARFVAPNRYLDVTPLLQRLGTAQAQGNTLVMPNTNARILTVRDGRQPWGERVVLELSQPAFWQVSQAKEEAVVTINAGSTIGGQGNGSSSGVQAIDQDDLGGKTSGGQQIRYRLERLGSSTKIHFRLPVGYKLQVSTLTSPFRLVIDARVDAPPAKTINWAEGITWQQRFVNITGGQFPVTTVTVNPRSPGISLRPLMANSTMAQGTAPLVTIAREQQAAVAINAGFFNRNNQLPLGAVWSQQNWLSGPILNRGAIAWNNQGQTTFGRLSLSEIITTGSGQRLTANYLNSGYVQRGIARYTPAWGPTYVPLSDNERVYVVQSDQITAQYPLPKAGQQQMSIPNDGYLIIDRGSQIPAGVLAVGTTVNVNGRSVPEAFNAFPNGIGAGPLLIDQGRIVLNAEGEGFSSAFQQQRASRSAIAVDRNGNIILVASHNRVGGAGASLGEFAQILQQLGAVNALNLDGGSSTSLALGGQLLDRSPVTAARVSNAIGVFIR
ncbi:MULTISPECIES: phosphodiester glycosidase family protein [unclassified Synechocystis]|uniref:phosphodiester glycosidase family protein n=1 Tax=unclassified Synechocystis TaxID=2640012 RepID=UPI001EE68B48|nr:MULTISPECIES: phosphodiester glycosidase family protein [unclassified Synechocystis]